MALRSFAPASWGSVSLPQQNTDEHYLTRDLQEEIYVYSTQYTAATGIAGLPEFSAVSFLYGKQIDYYDMRLESSGGGGHKEGHGSLRWLRRVRYDGGNFLSLDLENKSFTAFVPQAKSMAQEWNRNRTQLESLHRYYTHECVAWLKTMFDDSGPHGYLKTGLYGLLQAIVLPIMTLHLKRSFPPAVLCHVTGLSTSTVEMSWERNEKEVDDYVMIGKTLLSGDGKFQKTIYLFAESEDLMKNEYRCVLTFKTLKGKTIASMNQQLHLIYDQSHSYSRRSKWGSKDDEEDDYDEEDYDEGDYDEGDYDEDDYDEDDYDKEDL
ncbi:hypothetical protein NFI96_029982, partial [Prochilodus magdalenae]